MLSFVLDASVTGCWLLGEAEEGAAQAARARFVRGDASMWVPALWWYEVRNLLVMQERRGRASREATDLRLAWLADLPVIVDEGRVGERVVELARRHGLTVYDASYLELASRRALALATLDGRLTEAARQEGVALV